MEIQGRALLTSKINILRKRNPCQLHFGEIIQDGIAPFAKVLFPAHRDTHCSFCFKPCPPTNSKCGGCGNVSYCGKRCQVGDWKYAHKLECGLNVLPGFKEMKMSTKTLLDLDEAEITQTIRSLAILKLHPEKLKESFPLWNGGTKSLQDLFQEVDEHLKITRPRPLDRQLADYQLKEFAAMVEVLGEALFPKEIDPRNGAILIDGLTQVWEQFGIILNSNVGYGDYGFSQKLKFPTAQPVGIGIFIPATALKHSCTPNSAMLIDEGGLMKIRSVEKLLPGEAPTINFLVDAFYDPLSASEKKEMLKIFYPYRLLCTDNKCFNSKCLFKI